MNKWHIRAATLLAAGSMAIASPASASIFEYGFANGDTLTIDTETLTGTWVGNTINARFNSDDFATFQGGLRPDFTTNLTNLTGTRIIGGVAYGPSVTGHQPMLARFDHATYGNIWNLWANWGDNPIRGGDYHSAITSYNETLTPGPGTGVPAPGMLALFGLGLAALGIRTGRRRRKLATA